MKQIKKDAGLVAFCGLYCGACGQYLKERCPGCRENAKATWCKIRICCKENDFRTCADCTFVTDVNDCAKFNNFISKIFALIFRSNRKACIEQIRNNGIEEHAAFMTKNKLQSLKRS